LVQGYFVPDFTVFLLAVLCSTVLLFLLTYLALKKSKGTFHEIYEAKKHPYRFTFWLALGNLIGSAIAYSFLCYFELSQLEILGYLIFFQFLIIFFLAITFGVKLWNLKRKISANEHRCPK